MHDFTDLITSFAWTKDEDRKRKIGQSIWEWYGANRTVLVLDLCGFSRRAVGEEGILSFLAIIRRMQAAARPIVWMHEGEIVKMEADNCFAVFKDPEEAAAAAFELVAASKSIRALEKIDLEICCGIETGRILYLKGEDFFGEAVNIAARLGEDLAKKDQILVGPTARAALAQQGWQMDDFVDGRAPDGAAVLKPTQ
ncbi:MAG: adenylate/guanylate cyclase domain-containing protein [Alphaproteobacteria bacterium]